MVLSARAYAKINLGLLIHGKRDDGYHEIETVFHHIDLYDEIRLESQDKVSIETDSDDIPSDESNLCWKAVTLLNQMAGTNHGVRVKLKKNIPAGAGLGGGSADAATVLRLLPRLWKVSVPDSDLANCAARLGSDVSFFLGSSSAHGRGRGDILEPFRLPLPYAIVICFPGIHVSTPWAYGQITKFEKREAGKLKERLQRALPDLRSRCDVVHNDFEEPVFRQYPRLGKIKHSLLEAGAVCASLSGSGSSVYGLFAENTSAMQAALQLRSNHISTFYTPAGFQIPSETKS